MGIGAAYLGYPFSGEPSEAAATRARNPAAFGVPKAAGAARGPRGTPTTGPQDKTLRPAIPEMARTKNDGIPAAGARYTCGDFGKFVMAPTDLSVRKPVPGKNVLTLQACALPDYGRRLIVRAGLAEEAPSKQDGEEPASAGGAR